ncbi:MAG: hypothetical protein ACD_39C00287G0002 [uncultured bacterium]|nr:MAG: hypothetical protein ACD_39C00287G0002 [uncultured bacterium]
MNNNNSTGLSLTWKLRIPFVCLFMLFCGLGFFSLMLLDQLESITSNLHEEIAGFADLDNVTKIMSDERYLLSNLTLSNSTEDLIKIDKLLTKNREEFAQACSDYEKSVFSSEGSHLFDTFQTLSESYYLEADVVFDLAIQGKMPQAQAYIKTNADIAFRQAINVLNQLRGVNSRVARNAFQNTSKVYGQGKIVLFIAIIMVSIGTMLIARFMRLSIFVPILNLTRVITRLASWEMNVEIPEQDRHDELGSMAKAITALQNTARKQQQTTWIKAKLQEITQEIQKAEQIDEFADTLLNKLAPIMDTQVAAFYAFDILEESFKLTGSYGFLLKPGHPTHFRNSEGLIGQCATDKAIRILTDVPDNYISITSSVADGKPWQLLIAPILAPSEKVLAVLEFAAIKKIGAEQHDLLKELLPILGLNLQIIERNKRTKDLLQESQRQAIELAKQSEQIFFDQQEMQKQHDRLLQANADLASKTREVEATLEKLEEATKVKGVFLANMSHEIRTPMNAVIGMSHLCLKTELSEKQKDYIEKIQQAGFSLLEIINNILDFSKLEDGNMKVRSSLFHMTEFLDKATVEFTIKARNKGIEFVTQIDENLPLCLCGDQARIGQILHQLLANAVKFTEKGQISLRIRALERKEEQVKLRFEIHDTGIGMTSTQLSQLFQPFRQVDESSTRQFSGTGIGLALSKRLVEMLGGQIHAESQQGHGSTFSFELWCGLGTMSIPQTMNFSIEGFHVLVVDDNPVDRQILKEQLESVGMRVEVCSSGIESLAAISKADTSDPFKAVFMDWRLPGIDGIDIIRQIENLAIRNTRPSVILVTAFEIEDVRDQAELAGVKAFLPKPVTPSNLWNSLGKAFGSPIAKPSLPTMSQETSMDLRGMRVLLVEDNDLNQQIAKELLQSVGVAVTLADNGKTAIELLKSAPDPLPYDLVLMDIQMPIMDGHQATLELRKEARFKDLPIIALTAHAMEDEKQVCYDEGMNGHISKPIEPQLLFRLLANWTKRRPAPENNKAAELDTRAGLRRVAGNRQLYANLLQKFCEGQAGAFDKIRKALSDGDNNTAQRTAHTLKGISGNIGALALQNVAATIEKSIKSGGTGTDIESALADCEKIFAGTVAAITKFTASSTVEPDIKPALEPVTTKIDSNSAGRLLKRFHYLLAQSDGEAEDFLHQNESMLKTLLGETALIRLRESLSRFDFDEALVHLLSSANEKKINL